MITEKDHASGRATERLTGLAIELHRHTGPALSESVDEQLPVPQAGASTDGFSRRERVSSSRKSRPLPAFCLSATCNVPPIFAPPASVSGPSLNFDVPRMTDGPPVATWSDPRSPLRAKNDCVQPRGCDERRRGVVGPATGGSAEHRHRRRR